MAINQSQLTLNFLITWMNSMYSDDDVENVFTTKEQELLLQAALLSGDRALDAWHRWLGCTDIEDEMDNGSFRLLPLLFYNLKKHHIDHPIMSRLKGIYRHAWYNNHKLFFELSKILKSINNAGIPSMILKGAALTIETYKNYAIRPMADIDILVPEKHADLTNTLLKRAGWSSPADRSLKMDLKYRHSLNFENIAGFEFDLHWHPVKDSSIVASEKHYDHIFWQHAVPIKIVDEPTLAPGRPESLFLVIIHGTWRNAEPPIRWIADAMFLIDSFENETEWERFVVHVKNYSVPLQIKRALVYLKEKFDAPIPTVIFEALNRIRPTFLQRLVYLCSLGRTKRDPLSIIDKIPGIVEYLRVSGNRGLPKLLTGFPEYVTYRMHNKNLNDLVSYILSR
jgi:hypothetical protein